MIDFEEEFEKFVFSGDSSPIRDIHEMIPTLTQEQLHVMNSFTIFIERYGLDEWKVFLKNYQHYMSKNKNLNFLKSLNVKALLKAYTQDELIRGIKISSNSNRDGAV